MTKRVTLVVASAAALLASVASAAPRPPRHDAGMALSAALASRALDSAVAELAPTVHVAPLELADPECARRFGKGADVAGDDRRVLVGCLASVGVTGFNTDDQILSMRDNTLISVGGGTAIARIGYGDALPGHVSVDGWNVHGEAASFGASPAVVAAMAKKHLTELHARLRTCLDATGHVEGSKLVKSSGLAAFDREAAAEVARWRYVPFRIGMRAVPSCEHVELDSSPSGEEDGEVGGVAGGVMGGEIGGDAGGPPPPPPPPPPTGPQPIVISPTQLEALRMRGTRKIDPDDVTRTEIARSGKTRVIATHKLCVDALGVVASVTLLKSSGFAAYDRQIADAMRTWTFKPVELDRRPTPACTAFTTIYSSP